MMPKHIYGACTSFLCVAAGFLGAFAQDTNATAGATSACTPLAEALAMNSLNPLVDLQNSADGTQMAFNAASTVELPDADKVTIFVPTDAAIAAVPAANFTSEVVWNHVVLQYLPSQVLTATPQIATLSLGGLLNISSATTGVQVSAPGMPAPAMVTVPDILTCIGVVHAVDTVISRTGGAAAPVAPVAGPLVGATNTTTAAPTGTNSTAEDTPSGGSTGAVPLAGEAAEETATTDRSAGGVTSDPSHAARSSVTALGSIAAAVAAALMAS